MKIHAFKILPTFFISLYISIFTYSETLIQTEFKQLLLDKYKQEYAIFYEGTFKINKEDLIKNPELNKNEIPKNL